MAKPKNIHPSAIIEGSARIAGTTRVREFVTVHRDARIGEECLIEEKSCIGADVTIGDRCRIGTLVVISNGIILEDGVMVCANTTFAQGRYPRATTPELDRLLPDPEEDVEGLPTIVKEGATIGANCTISTEIEIGRFAMIGIGSVVEGSVGDFQLVVGNPAQIIGSVCRCGHRTSRYAPDSIPHQITCQACKRQYQLNGADVFELVAEPA